MRLEECFRAQAVNYLQVFVEAHVGNDIGLLRLFGIALTNVYFLLTSLRGGLLRVANRRMDRVVVLGGSLIVIQIPLVEACAFDGTSVRSHAIHCFIILLDASNFMIAPHGLLSINAYLFLCRQRKEVHVLLVSGIVNATAGRRRITVADNLIKSHRLSVGRPFRFAGLYGALGQR